MDLVAVILFLVLYYLRPQEWSSMFATIHFVQIIMLIGLSTLFLRKRGVGFRDIFSTPHDWAVFAFWLWIVVSAPHPWDTFRDNANLYIFYLVIVQALRTVPRMKIFLGAWTLLIVAVALLALASQWGFDPLGSLEITNGSMKGRLVLNLSIFNNPNALGHSVVPVIPMLYYYFFWKRPLVLRCVGAGLLCIPLYCIFLTISKGAFLCAAITMFATMTFGRPRIMQVVMIAGALMFGTGALLSLPRMNELNKTKTDGAIQGRVAAFKHGYQLLETTKAGVGKGQWGQELFMTDYVPTLLPPRAGIANDKGRFVLKPIRHGKAPHSSYVCIGAELGMPGLFLFLGVLYCCLRTTISAQTENPDEERIRRMLFVLVVSYIVSSWMVDFEYRPTFFMFAAAIAALHRHLSGLLAAEPVVELEEPTLVAPIPVWRTPELLPQPALAGLPGGGSVARQLLAHEAEIENAPEAERALAIRIAWNWNRIGLLDFAAVAIITYGVVRFWSYIIEHM